MLLQMLFLNKRCVLVVAATPIIILLTLDRLFCCLCVGSGFSFDANFSLRPFCFDLSTRYL